MHSQTIVLSHKELEIVQEVQKQMGFNSIEETMTYLAEQRIREKLLNLAGQEIKRKRH
ncbi:hypothetical protein ACFODO_13920 [Acinetobacter sichuanensis]|uniref:CopG family transcriptional regulator n=1 Tax=Acinetobacter sichuanensis TaxID=2136183 RepID=A0ABV7BFK3_9GAMM|nr:hypothetical protein [Acinetobacter sichuanensis]